MASVQIAMPTSRSSRSGCAAAYTLRTSSSPRPVGPNQRLGSGMGMSDCMASGIAQMNRRHSSAHVPISRSTSAAAPDATRSIGVRSRVTPSIIGMNGMAMPASSPSSAVPSPYESCIARSTKRCAGTARSAVPVARCHTQDLERPDSHSLCRRRRKVVARRARLRDRTVEQTLCGRRAEQRADAHAAGGLAEDRHVVRVAAERGDVVAYPPKRGDLVEDAEVAGAAAPPRRARRGTGTRARASR